MTTFGRNPCRWSPEVLAVIATLLRSGERVHDPFAGDGARLGALCDRLGLTFTGGDIEDWLGRDTRVAIVDAADPRGYPDRFTVVTSPVYANKRCADYPNGPTPTTKTKGRRDYGIAKGSALDERNLARFTGRPARTERYYQEHSDVVKLWQARVIVNVDEPISEPWQRILRAHGYEVTQVLPAYTQRYGGLDNADKRAAHEVVIDAQANSTTPASKPAANSGQASLG